LNFRGNASNYYDPENSYIHKVLRHRAGIPVSLSSVCLLLARRLEWAQKPLPLFGIGLPGHFIVQFSFPEKKILIDPFGQGKIVTRKDCLALLRDQEIPFRESYLSPVSAHAILCRTITNLVHIYSDRGEE